MDRKTTERLQQGISFFVQSFHEVRDTNWSPLLNILETWTTLATVSFELTAQMLSSIFNLYTEVCKGKNKIL